MTLVERLRSLKPPEWDKSVSLRREAADEIERLTAMQQGYRDEASELRIENERLRNEIKQLKEEKGSGCKA